MCIRDSPTIDELSRIVDLTTAGEVHQVSRVCDRQTVADLSALVRKVKIAENVKRYALRITMASRPEDPEAPDRVRQFVNYGASPRAAQSMILGAKVKALADGRYNVSLDDLRAMALPSLRHRILLNFEGEVAKVTTDDLVGEILAKIRPS